MQFKISLVDNTVEEQLGFDIINADTAQTLPRIQTDQINTIKIGEGEHGTAKLMYNTGFLPNPIERNRYFSKDEKEELLKAQKVAKDKLIEFFGGKKNGGEQSIDPTNKYVWEQYGSVVLNNSTPNIIYNTDNIDHLILYWQIMSTAYDEIAVSYDEAAYRGCSYFLDTIASSDARDAEIENKKIEAFGKISVLQIDGDKDSLLYLCWALGDRKNFMMGFNKSTSISTLVKALYNYIEGKTQDKDKKKAADVFIKMHSKMTKNNDLFMAEVIIKGADYHNIIFKNKQGKYLTKDSFELGNTFEEAVNIITKAQNIEMYKELTSEVLKVLNNDV